MSLLTFPRYGRGRGWLIVSSLLQAETILQRNILPGNVVALIMRVLSWEDIEFPTTGRKQVITTLTSMHQFRNLNMGFSFVVLKLVS